MNGSALTIRAIEPGELASFFAYLDDHLRDNGRNGTALFQPMSRSDSRLPEDKRAAFSLGLATPLDRPGWRRVWIALDAAGSIAGHVDLRARPEAAAAHRALLGMGVHRDWRRQGVGSRLIETAIAWGRTEAGLGWIDLEVLSANEPAVALYLRHGFGKIGEYRQMFRIDGATLDYTLMALAL